MPQKDGKTNVILRKAILKNIYTGEIMNRVKYKEVDSLIMYLDGCYRARHLYIMNASAIGKIAWAVA